MPTRSQGATLSVPCLRQDAHEARPTLYQEVVVGMGLRGAQRFSLLSEPEWPPTQPGNPQGLHVASHRRASREQCGCLVRDTLGCCQAPERLEAKVRGVSGATCGEGGARVWIYLLLQKEKLGGAGA